MKARTVIHARLLCKPSLVKAWAANVSGGQSVDRPRDRRPRRPRGNRPVPRQRLSRGRCEERGRRAAKEGFGRGRSGPAGMEGSRGHKRGRNPAPDTPTGRRTDRPTQAWLFSTTFQVVGLAENPTGRRVIGADCQITCLIT